MPKRDGKPSGRISSYAFFVRCCREEHKKKHPGENIVFAEFTKKCAEKWKEMTPKEKKRFEEMAAKDKIRYDKEMAEYNPEGGKGAKGGKRKKDPNAPKRALSAFFIFCQEARGDIKKAHPSWSVGDIAKELGRRWEKVHDRSKYEALSDKDKKRYEKEMEAYNAGQSQSGSKGKGSPAKKARIEQEEDDDDEEEEEEEEEDDDDDDDDE